VVTPAGNALHVVAGWLRGDLVGTGGKQPCAHNARGTYTCTVRFHGGTRTILWNPVHQDTVKVAGAVSTDDQRGRASALTSRVAQVKVGYRPVMVTAAR
jgi:hypothetical protein